MAAATATPIELSKIAQEQILTAIKQGQEIALQSVEAWATTLAPLAKAAQASAPVALPSAGDLVANSFGFAEKIVASQKAFAEKIVAATAPIAAASASK
jgi:hypothetical protein